MRGVAARAQLVEEDLRSQFVIVRALVPPRIVCCPPLCMPVWHGAVRLRARRIWQPLRLWHPLLLRVVLGALLLLTFVMMLVLLLRLLLLLLILLALGSISGRAFQVSEDMRP
jgi:hypothetical protein